MQYYYVNSDGNVTGPEEEEKLRVLYTKGNIKGDTPVPVVEVQSNEPTFQPF